MDRGRRVEEEGKKGEKNEERKTRKNIGRSRD